MQEPMHSLGLGVILIQISGIYLILPSMSFATFLNAMGTCLLLTAVIWTALGVMLDKPTQQNLKRNLTELQRLNKAQGSCPTETIASLRQRTSDELLATLANMAIAASRFATQGMVTAVVGTVCVLLSVWLSAISG